MNSIEEKIEKDKAVLNDLKEKKSKLEAKIKKVEESIEYNTMLINQTKFNEVNNVIASKGLSFDEIIKAINNGDLLSLQEKIEQSDKEPNN